MAEFLDTFDVERAQLLQALEHFQGVLSRFQERRALEIEGDDLAESLIASELALVRRDLSQTRFTVGLFGLIKRGKSTLLNSLIGREVSSMHVTPETAVPVYVDYGETAGAEVYFADGSVKHVGVEDVEEFTSQKFNPNNARGVTYVRQHVPVGFLRNGTQLIDTPGLDDAEADETYTRRTLQELDVCDAGIIVFLSPPTVGATEMGFLTDIGARDLKKTFLICNMYPQHFHDPQTRSDVLAYVGKRIVEASKKAGQSGEVRIYPVCAYEAWQARENDDMDAFKRSGASRLLRDLEIFLSKVAGRQVLEDAADRVAKAADLAKAEVQVRTQLLDDPAKLEGYRQKVDLSIRELESQFEEAMNAALHDIEPLKLRVRGRLLQPFAHANKQLQAMQSLEEVEAFARRFRREVEVSGESAARQFGEGFDAIIDKLRRLLEQRFSAVMSDLAPNLPKVSLARNSMIVTADQLAQFEQAEARKRKTAATGAAAGGLAGGASAVAVMGATAVLLSPVGLVAGALVGWKLSTVIGGGSTLARAKQSIAERIDEVANDLVADFDRQVAEAVGTLRAAVGRRRTAFAADLYGQFDLVESITSDPQMLDSYRRDAERFAAAFDVCAKRAMRAVSEAA